MTDIYGKKCDQCGKTTIDQREIENEWISTISGNTDYATARIKFKEFTHEMYNRDFCSTECFLKHLNREQNDN